MKVFVIFLVLVGFVALTQQSFAWCIENEDWKDAPCYGTAYQNFSKEKIQNDWESYYDYKGQEWMEQKKLELMIAIRDRYHEEWHNESDANSNVFQYYYAFYDMDKYQNLYSPHKQLTEGFPFNEIQCKEHLILIQKYDGSPACVKPSSIPDLIKRNWTTTEVLLDMPLTQLEKECGHYSHNEFLSRMQNHTLDDSCHDFIIEKALEDEKKMLEQGYLFDVNEQVWKKDGFPDTMMSISYHYMINLELENEN